MKFRTVFITFFFHAMLVISALSAFGQSVSNHIVSVSPAKILPGQNMTVTLALTTSTNLTSVNGVPVPPTGAYYWNRLIVLGAPCRVPDDYSQDSPFPTPDQCETEPPVWSSQTITNYYGDVLSTSDALALKTQFGFQKGFMRLDLVSTRAMTATEILTTTLNTYFYIPEPGRYLVGYVIPYASVTRGKTWFETGDYWSTIKYIVDVVPCLDPMEMPGGTIPQGRNENICKVVLMPLIHR